MHPCSPALKAMVERNTALARFADPQLVEPEELERHVYRAVHDLSRTRPRIVEFAPAIALKRALEHVNASGRDRSSVQVHAVAGRTPRLLATG